MVCPASVYARFLKPLGYISQAYKTATLLMKKEAQVIWYQSPPTFLAHLFTLYKFLTGRPKLLIADCHSSALRPFWSSLPGTSGLLNRLGLILVHNEEAAATAQRLGLDSARLLVLETRPANLEKIQHYKHDDKSAAPTILVPCSFHEDEPLEAIIEAAALLPETRFLVTGDLRRAKALNLLGRAPTNLCFTGFLPKDDYFRLLATSTLVMGLTINDGVQLSVASEAVGAERPIILSSTSILHKLFWCAAVFVENDGPSIAAGCRKALAELGRLEEEAKVLRRSRLDSWEEQASAVKRVINKMCT